MYIILVILVFGVLIFVYELGYFVLVKLNGVKVDKFFIGMGFFIFFFKGKEIIYFIGLFLIGGYVSMMGEEEVVDDVRSFLVKFFFRRISIIIVGVVMNYILVICIFIVIIYYLGFIINIFVSGINEGLLVY